MAKRTPPIVGPGLVTRRILVAPADVVIVRALLEAHDHLGLMFAEDVPGALTLACPDSLAARLDEFLDDLATEITIERRDQVVSSGLP